MYLVFKIQRLLIVLQRQSPLSRAFSFLFHSVFSPSIFSITLPSSCTTFPSSLSCTAHFCTAPNPFVFGFSSWVWHIFGWLLWLCAVCGYATLLLSLPALPLLPLALSPFFTYHSPFFFCALLHTMTFEVPFRPSCFCLFFGERVSIVHRSV